MKEKYRDIRLSKGNKDRLNIINGIISDYQRQGLVLTLRQLYYQLVTRNIIPNQTKEYAKLSILLKEGRMGGIVDWNAIEDRLRRPESPLSLDDPEEALDVITQQYQLPRMSNQPTYVEVWVEKDALSGVLKRVTRPFHVPIVVNRGYSSVTAMHDAYQRFLEAWERNQDVTILYLGDFDPSGVDMIRDIEDRIREFMGEDSYNGFEVEAIALTKEQIKKYKPPPNPAKISDPRAAKYIAEHGATSWEVDALRPEVLDDVLRKAIERYIDSEIYDEIVSREEADKEKLRSLKQYL